jgi:hypothetical protein
LGSVSYTAFISISYVETLVRLLRLDEAVDRLECCEHIAPVAAASRPFIAAAKAFLLQLTGRLDESEATIDSMQRIAEMLGAWLVSLWLSYTRGWRRLTEGRLDEACAIYTDIEATMQRVGAAEPCEVPWAGHAVAAYVASGRDADARRVIGWLDQCADRLPCRWPHIAAATGRAQTPDD